MNIHNSQHVGQVCLLYKDWVMIRAARMDIFKEYFEMHLACVGLVLGLAEVLNHVL